jgi:hypothetical protein
MARLTYALPLVASIFAVVNASPIAPLPDGEYGGCNGKHALEGHHCHNHLQEDKIPESCHNIASHITPHLPPNPTYPPHLESLGRKLGWVSDDCRDVKFDNRNHKHHIKESDKTLFYVWRDAWLDTIKQDLRQVFAACHDVPSVIEPLLKDKCYHNIVTDLELHDGGSYQHESCSSHSCSHDNQYEHGHDDGHYDGGHHDNGYDDGYGLKYQSNCVKECQGDSHCEEKCHIEEKEKCVGDHCDKKCEGDHCDDDCNDDDCNDDKHKKKKDGKKGKNPLFGAAGGSPVPNAVNAGLALLAIAFYYLH